MEKESQLSIPHVVQVKLLPRGIRRFCGSPLFEVQLRWFLERIEQRIRSICELDEDPDPYLCRDEPRPEHGPGCVQEVCYDDNGLVIHMGPIRCPPIPQHGDD